jgi:hypothetical protein
MEWGFPNGDRAIFPTYSIQTHLGEIQIGVPDSWGTRVPHLIRFTKEQGTPSPDVEINIPIEHNRKVSGLYINSGKDYWLCSRGSFTSYRGQIKREFTFSHFDKWLVQFDDKGKQASAIPVCALSSPTIANDIATFVAAVLELKSVHKGSGDNFEPAELDIKPSLIHSWGSGSEYEGRKSSGGSEATNYEYLHGPLCNQLKEFLKRATASNLNVFITKNAHVDVAIVNNISKEADAIFEVKTASLPSAQVYSAVGQINYYKYLYGHAKTKLYLVLPLSCRSPQTQEFIESMGISIVYGDAEEFRLPNGLSLETDV